MFATITGPLPAPDPEPDAVGDGSAVASPGGAPEDVLRRAIAAQAAAGLELLSVGVVSVNELATDLATGLGIDRSTPAGGRATRIASVAWNAPITVQRWEAAASLADRPVKASIVGPYTLAWYVTDRPHDSPRVDRRRLTLDIAEALHEELRALVAAGCPFVEVIEDGATRLADHVAERDVFRAAQRRLTVGIETHLSLSIRGGNADTAGAATLLDAPYESYLFDLIDGPDNWRLVRQVPGERGIICGALDHRPNERPGIEEIVWAAHYAASSNRRGLERVGVAPGNSLERCTWDEASRRMALLGEAARLATAAPEEIGRRFDPRAVDIRSAAFGRYAPQRREARPPED